MKKKRIIGFKSWLWIIAGFLFFFPELTFSKGLYQISGFVRDSISHEVLIGASVSVKEGNMLTMTDQHGYFKVSLPEETPLTISYIGYQQVTLTPTANSLLYVYLKTSTMLDAVTISAKIIQRPGIITLNAEEIESTPALTGKPDVMKVLQLYPGVQTLSEAASQLLVRGGDPGQNLYLLDHVPVTYVHHLGGFMSVFNADMINRVDFYAGGFPASYGGKTASIVDIAQREGNISGHKGSYSLGVTDASLLLEGPAGKNCSYIVTARKTLVDPLMMLATLVLEGNDNLIAYGFHDINAKFTWRPNYKQLVSVNLYQGDDYLNLANKSGLTSKEDKNVVTQQWGNWLVSARWNVVLGRYGYLENIVSYNRYRNQDKQAYRIKEANELTDVKRIDRSSVQDISWRMNGQLSIMTSWDLAYGSQLSYLLYEPNYVYRSTATTQALRLISSSISSAIYFDNTIHISSVLDFKPSVRFCTYSNQGKTFPRLEPRVELTFRASRNHLLLANYMEVNQFEHLIFTQGTIMSKEIWVPATPDIQPQHSRQVSLTWNDHYNNHPFSTDVTIYYKKISNLVTLKEGYENIVGITGIEDKVVSGGTGTAYGAEFMLRKNKGPWTGYVSYAWSEAYRQFDAINEGKQYAYEFHRPHSISLNLNRRLNKVWTANLVWVYQTGLPYTPALAKQYTPLLAINNPSETVLYQALIYGERNSARMSDYHRLDLSASYTTRSKKGHKVVWTFSVYNAYNRKNAYDYYYNDNPTDYMYTPEYNEKTAALQLYKLSLFPVIPSVSYRVYFK